MVGEILQALVHAEEGSVPLLLRVALGVVIFPDGAQKLSSRFGGDGFRETMAYFAKGTRIPAVLVLSLIVVEFFGSRAPILVVLTRPVAPAIGVDMVVAAWMVQRSNGFFMNREDEGFEFRNLAAGIAPALDAPLSSLLLWLSRRPSAA